MCQRYDLPLLFLQPLAGKAAFLLILLGLAWWLVRRAEGQRQLFVLALTAGAGGLFAFYLLPGVDYRLPLFAYGTMIMVGFIACTILALRRAPQAGVRRTDLLDFAIWAILAGLLGARIAFWIESWDEVKDRGFWEFFRIWNGGLTFYGTAIGSTLALIVFTRLRRVSLVRFIDLLAPLLLLGLAVGRIGCTLNGCCYGRLWLWSPAPGWSPPAQAPGKKEGKSVYLVDSQPLVFAAGGAKEVSPHLLYFDRAGTYRVWLHARTTQKDTAVRIIMTSETPGRPFAFQQAECAVPPYRGEFSWVGQQRPLVFLVDRPGLARLTVRSQGWEVDKIAVTDRPGGWLALRFPRYGSPLPRTLREIPREAWRKELPGKSLPELVLLARELDGEVLPPDGDLPQRRKELAQERAALLCLPEDRLLGEAAGAGLSDLKGGGFYRLPELASLVQLARQAEREIAELPGMDLRQLQAQAVRYGARRPPGGKKSELLTAVKEASPVSARVKQHYVTAIIESAEHYWSIPFSHQVKHDHWPAEAPHSGPVYPTQPLSSLNCLLIFAWLWFYWWRRRFDWEILCLSSVAYGFSRFLIEFLRADNVAVLPWLSHWLTFSQLLSLPLALGGIIAYVALYRRHRRRTANAAFVLPER